MTPAAVCQLDEIPSGEARRFVLDGVEVAVVRIDDDVYALSDICSHQRVSLAEGEVWCDERQIECPKHGSLFDLTTGAAITLPATQPVPVYRAEVIDGRVVVSLDALDVDAPAGEGTT